MQQVLLYLGHRIHKLAESMDSSEGLWDVHVAAVAAYALNDATLVMEAGSYLLTAKEALRFHDSVMLHLRCMSQLALAAQSRNVLAWKLRSV